MRMVCANAARQLIHQWTTLYISRIQSNYFRYELYFRNHWQCPQSRTECTGKTFSAMANFRKEWTGTWIRSCRDDIWCGTGHRKSWINLRLQWLDANIPGLCVPVTTGLGNAGMNNTIRCYPNPSTGIFYFEGENLSVAPNYLLFTISRKNCRSKLIDKGEIKFEYTAKHKGVYFFTLTSPTREYNMERWWWCRAFIISERGAWIVDQFLL